jgi:hypothetical protein
MAAGVALALGGLDSASAGMAPDPRPGDTVLGKANGLTYVSDADFANMQTSTETGATCPDVPGKWRIAGGGFSIEGGADSTQVLGGSTPTDMLDLYGDNDLEMDDFWRVSATVSVGTTVTSYAICTKWDDLKYKRIDVPDSASGERSHIVKPRRRESAGSSALMTPRAASAE